MGTTPAAQIARLKITYPAWRIIRTVDDCQAVLRADPSKWLVAQGPRELEALLQRSDYHYRAGAPAASIGADGDHGGITDAR